MLAGGKRKVFQRITQPTRGKKAVAMQVVNLVDQGEILGPSIYVHCCAWWWRARKGDFGRLEPPHMRHGGSGHSGAV